MTIFRYDRDAAGIVTLTMDAAGPVNTVDGGFRSSLHTAVDRLYAERADITGVIVTSAKKTFCAGADLQELSGVDRTGAGEFLAILTEVKADLRRLETLGRPVVAALNGTALGGGFELALACHRRIAVNIDGCEYGLPEVTLGLLPGAGGVTRTVRMLGVRDALAHVLLRGMRHSPVDALRVGIVDELSSPDELLARARQWIADNPDAAQPWDTPSYTMPGGTPAEPELARTLPALTATLTQQLKGAPYLAPRAILAAAVEGAHVDLDTALRIESRYLVSLVTGQTAKNMMDLFFFDARALAAGPNGVFTDRLLAAYIREGLALLEEGVLAVTIERAALQAGYPAGPLTMADESGLDLQGIELSGFGVPESRVSDANAMSPIDQSDIPILTEIADRFLYVQTIETLRAVQEGVVVAGPAANLGAVLAVGFPAWTGGPLRFREQRADFEDRAVELAACYGTRFDFTSDPLRKRSRA